MANKTPPGEVYEGMIGGLKDSTWLTAMDLPPDRDVIVQIEKVLRRREVEFKSETKRNYGSLKFRNKDKELGLCATNLNTLSALFGPSAKALPGKWIALYVDHEVKGFGGKIIDGVRIRAKHVDPPKAESDPREPGAEG